MKQLNILLIVMLFIFNESFTMIKHKNTKTVAPHYSSISGRRYLPHYEEVYTEPYVFTPESLNKSAYFIDPNNPITAEDMAIERNRRMRALQLQRSEKRPYGAKAYYSGSTADLPVGVIPETRGF